MKKVLGLSIVFLSLFIFTSKTEAKSSVCDLSVISNVNVSILLDNGIYTNLIQTEGSNFKVVGESVYPTRGGFTTDPKEVISSSSGVASFLGMKVGTFDVTKVVPPTNYIINSISDCSVAGGEVAYTVNASYVSPTIPTITSHPDIYAGKTSALGLYVNYDLPTARDLLDNSELTVSCSPASGSKFFRAGTGNTTVTCTAIASDNNRAETSFVVTVERASASTVTTSGTPAPTTEVLGANETTIEPTTEPVVESVVTVAPVAVVETPVAAPITEVLGEEVFRFNMDLGFGMQNDDVAELQKRLQKEGFFKFDKITGLFGSITKQAVKDYQKAKGISYITGFCGPLTRAELNK